MSRFVVNPFARSENRAAQEEFNPDREDVRSLHRSLDAYTLTPLMALPEQAHSIGVGNILVKDESHRFGLKAFKALGSTYAIYRFIKEHLESFGKTCPRADLFYKASDFIATGSFTFCTATDGNHGRGVPWVARLLKQRSIIYMPGKSAPARIENIKREGADVRIVDGDYDAAVAQCRHDAEVHGWHIISDTSWPGYKKIPRWIMAGYLTMFDEISEQGDLIPDIVIVQAGVGALAASAGYYYRREYPDRIIKLVSVEPLQAACVLESIEKGEPVISDGRQDSIMVGLNCATPSLTAWPIIKNSFDLFLGIPDNRARDAMRTYYNPSGDDPRIMSGESGAAGLAALLAVIEDNELEGARDFLGLDSNSNILVLNTEGDTDPENFRRITEK